MASQNTPIMRIHITLVLFSLLTWSTAGAQPPYYYPPLQGNTWGTVTPEALGWCPDKVDSLIAFVGAQNSKSFIILKNGRIVVEAYYDGHAANSLWYWASAGKSLAAALVGLAQQDGQLSIDDPTSDYLGQGWTACPPDKEALITIRNQISMTTGLNEALDTSNMSNCFDPACFAYLADAGTRWAYHNSPYRIVQDVLEEATGINKTLYTRNRLGNRIGMTGFWNDYIFISNARSMARFGHFMLTGGQWANDVIMTDTAYFNAMIRPSQNLNQSYGYLWWLNGQPSLMYPGSQLVFPISLIPEAPADLYAAMGLNEQRIYVVPSQGLVVVRQGESAGGFSPAVSSFDNQLWARISSLACTTSADNETANAEPALTVYPNPANHTLHIRAGAPIQAAHVFDHTGSHVTRQVPSGTGSTELRLEVAGWPAGVYIVAVRTAAGISRQKVVLK